VARAATLGRLTWQVAEITAVMPETATASTILLNVPEWPGHLPGQHVDVRLTAEDGYTAERSYSIASPVAGSRLELTVQRITDGEVSSYLTDVAEPGDQIEVRGPIGGWFVWQPESTEPVLLVAGGVGIVPLMAMIRTRHAVRSQAPFRLVASVRGPSEAIYAEELARLADEEEDHFEVAYAYTRQVPDGWTRPPARIDADVLIAEGWAPRDQPTCFVCGPTGFVERAANLLTEAGYGTDRIKTERFGPTGGNP
jgi:ferredoxin-NADP reductase